MLPQCSEQALSQLLIRKEEEWRALQAHRAQLQEAALQDTQKRLAEAQGKLHRLQEDFVYNLQVLEERDQELEHCEALLAQARAQEEARQAESSELRVEVATLKQALARQARLGDELQQQQQRRVREQRLELERLHSEKSSELDQQREQYESLKWRLERKLEEVDGELALQRQELLLEFESEMQKREHEFRLKADDMSTVVLSHELKVKFLNKELEALKESGAQAAESLQKAETMNAELESRLQGQAWELRDLEAVKDARIKELEEKLHSAQLARKKEEETFKRKYEALDRLVREKDLVLVSVKGAHLEQQQAQEARVSELQVRCETLEGQLRKAEWTQAAAVKGKDAVIDRLREDVAALEAGRDAQTAQMAKEAVSRDLQVRTLREGEEKLKAQLARSQQDIDRYKQQLTLAVERERGLERQQVQLGLDWQRRCDDMERDQIQKSETLIQGLTEARDQVAARLQEAERALREQELVLRAVTLERDQAVEALRAGGPLPGLEGQVPARPCDGEVSKAFPSAEIQQLREQNTSLRNAVSQMRREMEALSHQIPPSAQSGESPEASPPDPGARGDTTRPGYILALEAEIQSLQRKFQSLEEQLVSVPQPPVRSLGPEARGACPQAHTETIGEAPRPSRAGTGLALTKLRDRVLLLDRLVTELRKKVWQRSLEPGLLHAVDQVQREAQELRAQVAELEQHLGTAGREGRGSPERCPAEGLEDGRAMGPEDQGQLSVYPQPGVQTPQPLPTPHLQQKLQEAARKILRLHLEKEQLIEMGNRLRAELSQTKGKPLPGPSPPAPEPRLAAAVPVRPGQPLGELQPRAPQDPQHTKKKSSVHPAGKSQPRSAQTATCQKENQSPKPPRAQDVPGKNGHRSRQSSSPASSSLRDTWQLLDLGSSPSGPPSQEDPTPEHPAPPAACCLQKATRSPTKRQAAFAIQGVKVATQSRAKPARPARPRPAKCQHCQQLPAIRNYSLKD